MLFCACALRANVPLTATTTAIFLMEILFVGQ